MTTRVKADWFVYHASDLVNDKFHGTFAECEDWLHENQWYAVTHVHFYNNVIVVVNRAPVGTASNVSEWNTETGELTGGAYR